MKKIVLLLGMLLFTATQSLAFENDFRIQYIFITGDTSICFNQGYETIYDTPPACVADSSRTTPYLILGSPTNLTNYNVWLPQCNSNDDGEMFVFSNTGPGTITVNAENDIYGVETVDGGASHVVYTGSSAHEMCVFDVGLSTGQWFTVPTFG